MSSIEDPERGTAEDQEYFRVLEDHLLQLRGRTTLLSPADWQVAAEWRRRGIPLELVTTVMTDLVARQRARRSKRGVSSLRYFRAAVEAAWEEQLELGAGARPPRFDPGPPLEARLAALAAAIPPSIPATSGLREEIATLEGDLEQVEAALVELDRRLVEEASRTLDAGRRAELDARAGAALRAVPASLPAEEREALRRRLVAQALREALHLPVLSLFASEALAAGGAREEASSSAGDDG